MDKVAAIERRYLAVKNRFVHYRRAGSGPPVVLIHQSPTSSANFVPLMRQLADQFTVFAFDTPGFGESDALPDKRIRAKHFADALAETFVELKLSRSAVFGTDTGAIIAFEFGCRHPDLVTGLVLHSIPIQSKAETQDRLKRYAPQFRPRWDGSHLAGIWTRMRDHRTWYPWHRHSALTRLAVDMPPPELLHERILDFYRAGNDYRHGYQAAFGFDAIAAAPRLRVPATVLVREGSLFVGALDRLPKLRPNQSVRHVGSSEEEFTKAIAASLKTYAKGRAPRNPRVSPIQGRINRRYVDLPSGQARVRFNTDAKGRPMVLLHDTPGSSVIVEPLLASLARNRPVYAMDLPGNGDSDPLPTGRPSIDDYAKSVVHAAEQLGLQQFDLFGRGSGASVAVEVAIANPGLVRGLILERVMLFGHDERDGLIAHLTPPIEISWDGSHFYRTWLMLRDQLLYWPWYDRSRDSCIMLNEDVSAEALHRWTVEVLKSYQTYHLVSQAALRYPIERRLPALTTRTLFCARENDPLRGNTLRAAGLVTNSVTQILPENRNALRSLFGRFLDL